MAENGRKILEDFKSTVDKEARFRTVRERQNEERQRKLEEIKAQALAAQIFKEQKEQERRRRFDELRVRDDTKRQQVEERKRAINEAEKDRLEFILRKNQQREQRLETKKRNERSSGVFAFGSSTPRMLDPNDVSASFWGTRRATSIQNIVSSTNSSTLTRRQSERDLDVGNKKRATSATGLERTGESSAPVIPAGCASGYSGRRRTDLVPTIPSKESISSSRKSLNHSPASSRPSSSLSQQSTNSLASSVSIRQRLTTVPRKPRPVSIAVTGISSDAKNDNKPPLPKTRKPITKTTTTTITSDKTNRNKAKTPVDNVTKTFKNPASATGREDKLQEETISNHKSEENHVHPNKTKSDNVNGEVESKVPQKSDIEVTSENKLKSIDAAEGVLINVEDESVKTEIQQKELDKTEIKNRNTKELTELHKKEPIPEQLLIDVTVKEQRVEPIEEKRSELKIIESRVDEIPVEKEQSKPVKDQKLLEDEKNRLNTSTSQSTPDQSLIDSRVNMENQENEMTTSMTKVRINTEEEAKAALAERRRLIREEAERQAELERLRLEAEAKAEFERQQREEEQIRQLIEQQRQSEQERLQEAIREAQKREEEEKLRREEELKLKLLKEEAERKAKEDAEKQKAELQERLKNEEKEREARRKRVEAIMLRTRGKNANNQQSTDEKNENKSAEEIKSNEENKVNGTKIDEQENGTTKIAKDIVDNLIPSEIVKNANTVTIESMNTNDSINSNNTWRDNQQYGNFVCNNNS